MHIKDPQLFFIAVCRIKILGLCLPLYTSYVEWYIKLNLIEIRSEHVSLYISANLVVIITVCANKRLHRITHVFIAQLGVGDLLILVFCMPFTVTSAYYFKVSLCYNILYHKKCVIIEFDLRQFDLPESCTYDGNSVFRTHVRVVFF